MYGGKETLLSRSVCVHVDVLSTSIEVSLMTLFPNNDD